MALFRSLTARMLGTSHRSKLAGKLTRRDLIEREATIGRELFGSIPEGRKRDFFCLDANTWVWHEEWTDDAGSRHSLTTRYEIHANGVMKVVGGHYSFIEGPELDNLYRAVQIYYDRTMREVYGRDPATGQPLAAV